MLHILRYFLPKKSIKRKILFAIHDMEKIVPAFNKEPFWIEWYGAYDIDPRNLVIWICVRTDEVKTTLQSNKELASRLQKTLEKNNYPPQAVPFVLIGFESQETVDRDSNGDWFLHFK